MYIVRTMSSYSVLYTVHCTLYTVHCTGYKEQWRQYTVKDWNGERCKQGQQGWDTDQSNQGTLQLQFKWLVKTLLQNAFLTAKDEPHFEVSTKYITKLDL